jgi:hypothetical protein
MVSMGESYNLPAISRPLALTGQLLDTYLGCQRRFQLQVEERYPWPAPPLDGERQQASARGQQFHQMAHRHFLGLPVSAPGGDPLLEQWWQRFQETVLPLPSGRCLPELTVTVPLGRHLLTGRLDLLLFHDGQALIFDWKTTPLPDEASLRAEWQSLLYPTLVVAAGAAIHPEGRPIAPDDLTMIYWSAARPDEAIKLAYSAAAHSQTWQRLLELADEIDAARQNPGIWPLTDDLALCSRCRYRVLCGRQSVAPDTAAGEEDHRLLREPLEPYLP